MNERIKAGLIIAGSIIAPTEEQRRLRHQVSQAADTARLDILTNSRATDETVGKVLNEIDKNEKKMKKRINLGKNPLESEDTQ